MQTIRVEVVENYARSPLAEIVCGNSEYYIEFAFSEEWETHALKTARFHFANSTIDRVFEGNVVQVPIVKDANVLEVGVYAGNLRTTTPALISCKKSILCREGTPEEPAEDVYNQIMQKIDVVANGGSGGSGDSGGGNVDAEGILNDAKSYTDEKMSDAEKNAVERANTYTDEKIGDIDTALDAIIALQNSLIDKGVSE